MPRGLNRRGNFSVGSPVVLPKNVGTAITSSSSFGNLIGISFTPPRTIVDEGIETNTVAVAETASGDYFLLYNNRGGLKISRRSTDKGATWSVRTQQWNVNTLDPTLAVTPGGDLIVEFGKFDGLGSVGSAFARSKDSGLTWGAFTFFDNPVANTSFTPTRYLNVGTDMYAAAYGPHAGGGNEGTILFSADDGYTWTKRSIIRQSGDAGINETAIAQVGVSSLIAISRDDVNTHTWAHFSTDMGLTWGNQIDYTPQVGILQLPQLLQVGKSLLLFGRDALAQSLVVFGSYDGGVTFTDRTVIDSYASFVGDSDAYCWPILRGDGRVFLVWSIPLPGLGYSVIRSTLLHWK